MRDLEQIKNDLNALTGSFNKERSNLESEAALVFAANMETPANKAIVSGIVNALESSKDLTDVEHDEFCHRWVRVEWTKLFKLETQLEKDLLREYFQENHFVNVDFKHDAATQSEGPCIIIDDAGDVFDQDSAKTILKRRDYETIEERNEKIEAWMDKNGYFPSVVSYGRYGVAGYVNTQQQKRSA